MEAVYNCLIDSYLKDKVGVAENFLSVQLAADLRANLLALDAKEQLREAGIGNKARFKHNKAIRTDKIHWLDKNHDDIHENAFFNLIDDFVAYLNRTCYTGIVDYEFHYAMYESGSFYKRHLDRFKDNSSRAFTLIFYLNDDWQKDDGGELCVYLPNETKIILPEIGKCVFFKSSELEHEVLLSHRKRLSITGWFKTN